MYTKSSNKNVGFEKGVNSKEILSTNKSINVNGGEQFYEIEPAQVIEVILDKTHVDYESEGGLSSIGKCKVRRLYTELSVPESSLNYAKPLNYNRTYPVKGEIVLVAQYPTNKVYNNITSVELYYDKVVSIWSNNYLNQLPSISKLETNTNSLLDRSNIDPKLKSTKLKPFEGDTIYEGRWNQSIRFTTSQDKEPFSNGNKKSSVIVISINNQVNDSEIDELKLEDINNDPCSIWSTNNISVPLDLSDYSWESYNADISNNNSNGNNSLENNNINESTDPTTTTTTTNEVSNSNNDELIDDRIIKTESNDKLLLGGSEEPLILFGEEYDDPNNGEFINLNVDYESPLKNSEIDGDAFDPEYFETWNKGIKTGETKIIWVNEVMVAEKYYSPFKSMVNAARYDNIYLLLNSSFRTFFQQSILYDKFLNGTGNLAAKPGYSNHQSGVAFDIAVGGNYPYSNSSPSKEYKWLVENALNYGFVRTVPTERWHWEYRPNASKFQFVPENHYSWDGLI